MGLCPIGRRHRCLLIPVFGAKDRSLQLGSLGGCFSPSKPQAISTKDATGWLRITGAVTMAGQFERAKGKSEQDLLPS